VSQMSSKPMLVTREELTQIVSEVVRREFENAGLIMEEAEHRQEAQKDFRFIRRFREAFDSASGIVGKAILTAIVVGVLGMLVVGFKLGVTSK
jgi:ABC-type bacteriocin/lantibiotic exporter with double-glycine peptidase domain